MGGIGFNNKSLSRGFKSFTKGANAVGNKISKGLGATAGALKKGGNFVAKLTSDPEMQLAVGVLAPELAPVMAGANELAHVAKDTGANVKQVQRISNGSAFHGESAPVTQRGAISGIAKTLHGVASIRDAQRMNNMNAQNAVDNTKNAVNLNALEKAKQAVAPQPLIEFA